MRLSLFIDVLEGGEGVAVVAFLAAAHLAVLRGAAIQRAVLAAPACRAGDAVAVRRLCAVSHRRRS